MIPAYLLAYNTARLASNEKQLVVDRIHMREGGGRTFVCLARVVEVNDNRSINVSASTYGCASKGHSSPARKT